jgi:hypothetical protein
MSDTDMSDDRTEELRAKLRRPRDIFIGHLEQALRIASGDDIIGILTDIRQAVETRAPTPRERALVDVVISPRRSGRRGPAICTCIRCGVTASLVATVLAGFACCGSCWTFLNGIHGSLELVRLNVDISPDDLDMEPVSIGSMDGVEL